MKLTLSVIKADTGSIGRHICPSQQLLTVVKQHVEENGRRLLIDHYVSFTGDDIAILMTHTRGTSDTEIHQHAWEAFEERFVIRDR